LHDRLPVRFAVDLNDYPGMEARKVNKIGTNLNLLPEVPTIGPERIDGRQKTRSAIVGFARSFRRSCLLNRPPPQPSPQGGGGRTVPATISRLVPS